jgi:hypothetical protein
VNPPDVVRLFAVDRTPLTLLDDGTWPSTWTRTFSQMRVWSSRTWRYARQWLDERTGQTQRTEDFQLEQEIQVSAHAPVAPLTERIDVVSQLLQQHKRNYEQILEQARQLSFYFAGLIKWQHALGTFTFVASMQCMTATSSGDSLNDIQQTSGSSDELADQIVRNGQCQRVLAVNGDALLGRFDQLGRRSSHRLSSVKAR